MVISSTGFDPASVSPEERIQELALFLEHLQLILDNSNAILKRAEYFFCQPVNAWCSWPYVTGDGPIPLGYLLLAWQQELLTAPCPECGDRLLVVTFGGSPLSGSNWCNGCCQSCGKVRRQRWEHFWRQAKCILKLRDHFPFEVREWEEYDGFVFSWGDSGLRPARKERLLRKQVCEPVSLSTLIGELKSGTLRAKNPPNVHALGGGIKLKFD
jgi:hypothetical protein